MKHLQILLAAVALVMLFAMPASAQSLAAMIQANKKVHAQGVVYYKNGQVLECADIILPKSSAHIPQKNEGLDVKVHTNDETMRISHEDIYAITVWQAKTPENKTTFYTFSEMISKKNKNYFYAIALPYRSAWGRAIINYQTYDFDKQGNIIGYLYNEKYAADVYILRHDGQADRVGLYAGGRSGIQLLKSTAKHKKDMMLFFENNEALVDKLINRTYKGQDLQLILDEMAATVQVVEQQTVTDTIPAIMTIEEEAENGVEGDDE